MPYRSMVAVMRPLVIRAASSAIVICGWVGAGGSRAQSWGASMARWRVARTRRLFSPHGSTQRISPPWRRTSRSPSWLRYCLLTSCYLPVERDRQERSNHGRKGLPRVGRGGGGAGLGGGGAGLLAVIRLGGRTGSGAEAGLEPGGAGRGGGAG